MSTESQPLQTTEEKQSNNCFLANVKVIARTIGLITIAVLWVSTVILLKDHKESYVGYYLIAASSIVTFLELTWVLDKLACCVRAGCCCRIWSAIIWVDNWKKFIIYILLSIPLFLEDMRLVLGIVSGLLLILLSIMYLITTFRSYTVLTTERSQLRQSVITTTPSIRLVKHEISTQTDTEHGEVDTSIPPDVTVDGGTPNQAR